MKHPFQLDAQFLNAQESVRDELEGKPLWLDGRASFRTTTVLQVYLSQVWVRVRARTSHTSTPRPLVRSHHT